ncbi:phoenix isoform X2 [Pseudorasbora parva]
MKTHRRRHLPLKKHQILENSEIGGFLKCIKKLNEGYVKTGRAISPYMLESELSENSEDDHSSDHEVTKVDKTIFVPSYSKGNVQKWLTQSILEKRILDSLSKDNNKLNVSGKENKRKAKSTKKNKTSAAVKKKSKKKCKVPTSKAVVRTLSESACDSLSEMQEKQHEPHEVLASCSDAESLDSSHCGQPLNNQIVQCAKNLHGNNLLVIKETQRHSVESVIQMEHEDDISSGTDNHLPNKNYFFFPPQGGHISVQNEIQQTDSDIGSVDLFMPLNSQEHKNNQIHKTTSITANMESVQDCDLTRIETEGHFDSMFGLGTPRWCDGECLAHEDNESDLTQLEMEGESVSVFEPTTTTKQFIIQEVNHTKHSESQKTGHSPAVLHTELMSREDKTRHKNKKRKSKSSSHKDVEVTGIESVNVQPSSKHLPLADESLREVNSSYFEHVLVGKQRTMVGIEMDTQDSPLFKNGGMSSLNQKRKKKKIGATIVRECDTNDVSQKVSSMDVTELKTCRENRELCAVEKRVINKEQTAASVLQSEETSELLEKSILSTVEDVTVIKKAKRKNMKMYKLNDHEDAEPGVEKHSVEAVQFSDAQSTELTLKRKKKKRNDKEGTKTAYAEENSATDILSNKTLDSDRPAELRVNEGNQSSEAPETDQPKHMQTSEEVTGCPLPNVTRLKSVKKKKRDKTEESQYESVDLNVSFKSQFDAGLRVTEQQEDGVIEESLSNGNAAEHLEGNTASILKVAKHKKKSQNVSSPSQIDYVRLEKQGMQSASTAEPNHLGSDDTIITNDKQKKAKKQKLKERKTKELASDIKDIVQFHYSESNTTDLLSRRTKKKRANKDREKTTVSSSSELLEHMEDSPLEMRGNMIHSTEANQTEHLLSSEGITGCQSPSVTRFSSGKKKKKKRVQSEECPYESVDFNLDVSSVSQLDVTVLSAQKMIERRQSNAVEHFDCYSAHILNVAKRNKKSQNASSQSQVDDVIGLENAVLDLQSGNTIEENKKKKHKLKVQVDAETNAVTHSVDNVHLVETDQFTESKTTELTLKRTKKKRKEKEKKTAYIEENSATDILAIKTFEAIETDHPEHLQTSEQIEQCLSPNVTRLKSVKNKKKRNGSDECDYESEDFLLDASLGSQFDNVTDRSTTQQSIGERSSDIEHLESNTEAKLNDTKSKKKRKLFH